MFYKLSQQTYVAFAARTCIAVCIIAALFLVVAPAHAQTGFEDSPEFGGQKTSAETSYQPLTAIPGVPETGDSTLVDYVNALFLLTISIGAMLAVVKIALGGFQYMMSGLVTTKESAKKDIWGALIGLAILLSSVAVLVTIYPDLVNVDILRRGTALEPPPQQQGSASKSAGQQNQKTACEKGEVLVKYTDGSTECRINTDRVKCPEGQTLVENRGSFSLWATFSCE